MKLPSAKRPLRGLRRRLVYVYGIPAVVYLVLVLVLIAWTALNLLPSLSSPLIFLSIPAQILLSGSLGSVLRGVTALWFRVDNMEYRKVWGTWFLLNPFMGALLGGV